MATLVDMDILIFTTNCYDGCNFSSSSSICVNSKNTAIVAMALMTAMAVMVQMAIMAIMAVLAIRAKKAIMSILAPLTT